MKKPTPAQCLKHLGPIVNDLLLAQAYYQQTKEEIEALDAPLLAKYGFKDDEGQAITETSKLYLTEADCTAFYAERADAIQAAGWPVERDYCPYLVIGCEVSRLQRKLVDAAAVLLEEPLLGSDNLLNQFDKYKEFVELATKMVVSLTGFKKPAITKTPKEFLASLAK